MTENAALENSALGNGARIAVLMTCFNRRNLTLSCLETLRNQQYFREEDLFLVDDGSRDGTGEAVLASMPGANVVRGDGSLFWNGGMRLAWDSAKSANRSFDFYLWLNDDVQLAPGALAMLVADADAVVGRSSAVIVAAALSKPGTGTITYGAHIRPVPHKPLRLSMVAPQGRPTPVDTISGNVVLVSAAAEAELGNMHPAFEHIYGDLDYGFRARTAGVPMALASGLGGTCDANPLDGSSLDRKMGKVARLRQLWRENKKVHARDWRRFVKMHGGPNPLTGLMYRASPYLRILMDKPNSYASHVIDR